MVKSMYAEHNCVAHNSHRWNGVIEKTVQIKLGSVWLRLTLLELTRRGFSSKEMCRKCAVSPLIDAQVCELLGASHISMPNSSASSQVDGVLCDFT